MVGLAVQVGLRLLLVLPPALEVKDSTVRRPKVHMAVSPTASITSINRVLTVVDMVVKMQVQVDLLLPLVQPQALVEMRVAPWALLPRRVPLLVGVSVCKSSFLSSDDGLKALKN